jgi:hypothetical protein
MKPAALSRKAGGPGGSSIFNCDPTKAASHLFDACDHRDFPSLASLAAIAALRLRHVERGHTPASDSAHGPVFFTAGSREFISAAMRARDPAKRRAALVAAAALIVALIDAEDFTTAKELPRDE